MSLDLQQERQQAHALLDLLPPIQLGAVRNLLESMVPTFAEVLAAAPVDTEELNDETIAELTEARAAFDRGEGIPHEEILREFGILHR